MRNNQSNRFGRHLLLLKLSGISIALLACGSVFAQPANDDCATATEILSSAPPDPYTDSVDATNATLDPTDPLLTCNAAGNDDGSQTVWWTYTPDSSGWVDFNTVGSTTAGGGTLDTAHGAFTGSCGALVEVACVDQGLTDSLNVNVTAGETYYIKVGQFAGGNDAGTVQMSVNEGEPPLVPQLLTFDSRVNGTSSPLTEIVGVLYPETSAAARSGNKFEAAFEVPNRSAPDVSNSKTAGEVVGSIVPGGGTVKWRGPAELMQVFGGVSNADNYDRYGGVVAPPDTVGDVGKDYYIQQVNLLTEIFDKEGNSVLGPFPTSAFFAELPSFCSISDDGDPIVLYDEESERWMVSQFLASFQDGLCIAISTTSDPLGTWNTYEFDFTGIGFPDYPKFGFATGALNVMVNLFNPLQGSALGAIDKAEMLAGDPATMVLFTGGENLELFFGWVPGDNDGPVFDNTPSTFFTGPPFFNNILAIATLTPDWLTPENSTLNLVGLPVTPYDSTLCNAPRGACITQPGSGTSDGGEPGWSDGANTIAFLESISSRLMHRGQTRDFGSRKVAMLSHTVDADGSGKAGVRWYELRNHKDRGWTLKKEETFSPDGDNRWMGSIAMTASGETCLGYSISSLSTHPSIGITGRKGTSNHMNIKELVAFDGNVDGHSQRATARWGDYSSMSIDPVDDTCWYTQEHATFLDRVSNFSGFTYGEIFGWDTKIIQYDVN